MPRRRDGFLRDQADRSNRALSDHSRIHKIKSHGHSCSIPIDPATGVRNRSRLFTPHTRFDYAHRRPRPTPHSPLSTPHLLAPSRRSCRLETEMYGKSKNRSQGLAKFDTTIGHDVQSLNESVQKGDATAAAASAHKIKGAAANVSADGLRRIAAELEQLLHADALSQTQDGLDQLQRELDRFRQHLSAALGELTPNGTAPPAAAVNPDTMPRNPDHK